MYQSRHLTKVFAFRNAIPFALYLTMPISIGTELERVGIVGPELELSLGRSVGSGRWTPLQKQERKRIGGGSPVVTLMPKSVLSCGREYQLLRE